MVSKGLNHGMFREVSRGMFRGVLRCVFRGIFRGVFRGVFCGVLRGLCLASGRVRLLLRPAGRAPRVFRLRPALGEPWVKAARA